VPRRDGIRGIEEGLVIDLVCLDLDGTLVDTKDDLAGSVNALRVRSGLPAVEVEQVVRWVGDGARLLVARGLGVPDAEARERPEVTAGLVFFRGHYVAHMMDRARPYPGVVEGLGRLAEAGKTLAVVSNKPVAMCRQILEALALAGRFAEVVGGDSLPVRKPDPAPVLHVLEHTGTPAARTAMVGDGVQDLRAGRAAGCRTIAALWGFRPAAMLRAESPDHEATTFEEAVTLLL
jgi:phosphoglycolate phosphatase